VRRCLVSWITLAFALALALGWGRVALAEPIATWGGSMGITSEGDADADAGADADADADAGAGADADADAGAGAGAGAVTEAPEAPPIPQRYTLEDIEVHGNTSTLGRVVLRYVPFKVGEPFDVTDERVALTRFRLLGTGFFREVQLSLKRGSRRGLVVLVIDLVERNTIVVNDFWLGLASDVNPSGAARPITAYGGIDASENNLAGTGLLLGGALAVADRQLALRARFAAPQIGTSSFGFNAQVLFSRARDFFGNRDVLTSSAPSAAPTDYAVVTYDRFGGLIGGSYEITPATHLFLDYRLERIDAALPAAASHRRGTDVEPIDFYVRPGGSVLSTLRATLSVDTRDEPVLTSTGTYLGLVGELALPPIGSDYPFAKVQLRAAHWFTLPWKHVLRLDAFAGAIVGDAPLYERYYVGDFTDLLPDRVLDLAFDRRAAPNFFGTSISELRYGQYAGLLSAEYRIPIYRGRTTIYGVDLFGSAGLYGIADERTFTSPPSGYTTAQRIPVDLTFNLGLRIDSAFGAIRLGASTFVGFIPFNSEAQ
jgi:outer membrane protein assembly factor BamA